MTDAEDSPELRIDPDGTIHVPAFRLPPSAALSDHARAATAAQLNRRPRVSIPAPEFCASEEEFAALVDAFRITVDAIYSDALVTRMREVMPVIVTVGNLGGVSVEEFAPIDDTDMGRVLINLHGGAFCTGAIHLSRVESIPLAHHGKFRVVSPDYRQGYEHKFPAASEDVCAVYRALLENYAPSQIGIYGGSAGGILTSQATAWILAQGLPAPGRHRHFRRGHGRGRGMRPGSARSAWARGRHCRC